MFKPAPLFGDHCVLAMGKELRLFGEAPSGSAVTARLEKDGSLLREGCCVAEDDRFLLLLPAVDTPCDGCALTIACGDEAYTAKDVAVGLVFLAGGQSNMELELQNADEGEALIKTHEDAWVRYFNVPKQPMWNDEAIRAENWSHWECIRPGYGKDMSAVAYFYAMKARRALNVPVGVIDCYWGGTSITCWMDEEALGRTTEGRRYMDTWNEKAAGITMEQYLEKDKIFHDNCAAWEKQANELRAAHPEYDQQKVNEVLGPYPWNPPVGPGSPFRPCGLAETMLKRVTPCALSGMLYYQAEADVWETACYEQLMVQLVLRWRELFRDMDVPFQFVQLPMWIDAGAQDDGKWAAMRLMQAKAAKLIASCDMCCLIDGGEYNNIHPTDKRTPGERLADLWLLRAGREGQRGPEALRKETRGDTLVVTASAPLVCDGEPALFEIAGQDGAYVPAKAEVDGTHVRLTAEGVAHPAHARYAHVAYGKVNVFGENGLPLAPFAL